jgi:glycopeptide antibiotics resistance protein
LALLGGGAAYVLALVAIATWPRHVDASLRPRLEHGYEVIELVANIVLFMPFGALAMLVAPRVRWSWVVVGGCVASGCIELVQAVLLPGRTGSVQDVVANTLGAALGAAVVVAVRWVRGASR